MNDTTSSSARQVTPLARYRLARAALDLRTFTVSELVALTRIPANTVYSFLSNLSRRRVRSEILASSAPRRPPGRPRKVYTLTGEGVEHLAAQNLEVAAVLRAEGLGAPFRREETAPRVSPQAAVSASAPARPAEPVQASTPGKQLKESFQEWATERHAAAKARDIMTENPACITPETSARQAARLMEDHDVGSLPVIESDSNRRLVGVVTDRDLALHILSRGDLAEVQVREVMSSHVHSCRPEDSLDDVENAMAKHQVRRIPIVDENNRILGMVAQADLARERKAVGALPAPGTC